MKGINDIIREQLNYDFDLAPKLENRKNFQYLKGMDMNAMYTHITALDYYKFLVEAKMLGYITSESRASLDKINSIDDRKEILKYINSNHDSFRKSLDSTLEFFDMSIVEKQEMLNDMTKLGLNKKLMTISPLHIIDLITYQPKYDCDSLAFYYRDFMDLNLSNPTAIYRINEIIVEYMTRLEKENEHLYKKNILEIIGTYYKWKKYIQAYNDFMPKDEYLVYFHDNEYVEFIENHEVNDIFARIKVDPLFYNTILLDYLHYVTSDIEVPIKVVDKFAEQGIDDKVKKKLKIKDDKKTK